MKKTIVTLALLTVTVTTTLNAQKQYVYLKSGSVIKGKIIYTENQDEIKIESRGNIFAFNRNDIDTVLQKVTTKTTPQPLEFNNFFRVGVDILIGNSSNEEKAPALFQASFNHTLYKNISVGIGSGMEYYKETTFIPAFINVEYRFRNTRFSPFLYFKGGYLFSTNETKQTNNQIYYGYESFIYPMPSEAPLTLHPYGGVLINPGVGFNVMIADNFGFAFGVGYRYHKIGFDGDDGYSIDYQYNRLSVNLGILFK